MRIISGKYKGQKLTSFNLSHLRPTSDRMKETLFNIITPYLSDESIVLDCYCGTGSLGLEALSRGVKFVSFLDINSQSINVLKSNIKKLNIPKESYQIFKKDSLHFLKKNDLSNYDIILIDPPFTKKIAQLTLNTIDSNATLKNNTLIAIEVGGDEPIKVKNFNSLQLLTQRVFNDKTLFFFLRQNFYQV